MSTILTAVITSVITALLTSMGTFIIQERRLRTELRTQFMAEEAAKTLLQNERWKKRSFDEIKKRLGGFGDDDLRKILVRAGAVRFEDLEGKELWGLILLNKDAL